MDERSTDRLLFANDGIFLAYSVQGVDCGFLSPGELGKVSG